MWNTKNQNNTQLEAPAVVEIVRAQPGVSDQQAKEAHAIAKAKRELVAAVARAEKASRLENLEEAMEAAQLAQLTESSARQARIEAKQAAMGCEVTAILREALGGKTVQGLQYRLVAPLPRNDAEFEQMLDDPTVRIDFRCVVSGEEVEGRIVRTETTESYRASRVMFF